jgi:NAD(P)-dependent dehydrogenase (short-subunit alcohol dehydrogenase family)
MAKILVTGANGGFGKLTVTSLIKNGHKVVASMRDVEGRNLDSAEEFIGLGAKVVEMDVTKDDSVAAGVSQALEAAGGLDVVVNNAGIGVLGVQETFTPEDWQRLFNVNLFGVQRVIRAVLPHMREKRAGLLVQISSLLGRIAIPFCGPYNASKWALEAMSENYRVELSGFGVDVVIIEPGTHLTTAINGLMQSSDKSRDSSLGTMPQDAKNFLHGFVQALAANPEQNPQNVADAIVKVIETPAGQRPFRTIIDKMGMGSAIQPYNEQLDQLASDIYAAFGIGQMRELKTQSNLA